MKIISRLVLILIGFLCIPTEAWAGASTGAIGTHKSVKEFLTTLEEQSQKEADLARQSLRFVRRDPFVPQTMDYGVELGALWQESNFYNVGANIGWHVGTCIFSDSETCQQFADLIGDLSGRESYTHYTGLASLRWQFVSFPSSWSQMSRVFAGIRHSIIPKGNFQTAIYGVGWGFTTYLHPKADLRVEFRVGGADREVFSEVMMSIQLKIDRWIEYFAGKVKDLGLGTVDLTGQVVKGTVGVTGEVVKGTVGVTGQVIKGTAETVGSVGETAIGVVAPGTSKKESAPVGEPTPSSKP